MGAALPTCGAGDSQAGRLELQPPIMAAIERIEPQPPSRLPQARKSGTHLLTETDRNPCFCDLCGLIYSNNPRPSRPHFDGPTRLMGCCWDQRPRASEAVAV